MAKLWELFERSPKPVLALEIETKKIVFANDALSAYIHLDRAFLINQTYEHLIDFGPSDATLEALLRRDQGNVSERTHTLASGQKLTISDTVTCVDDKLYVLEVVEVPSGSANQSAADVALDELNYVVDRAVKDAVKEGEPRNSIDVFLLHVGEALKGDRAYLIELDAEGHAANTHEWTADGRSSAQDGRKAIDPELYAAWTQSSHAGKASYIQNVELLKSQIPRSTSG